MAKRLEIKQGDKYNKLTIIKEVEPHIYPSGKTRRKFLCQCDCGSAPFEVLLNALISGNTKSCGCHKIKTTKKLLKKHNKYNLSGEYGVGYTSSGIEFYFDLQDYDRIKDYCWRVKDNGYLISQDNRKTIYMHRILFDDIPEEKVVDHINRNKLDNRRSNLRICTYSNNNMNKSTQSNNTSGMTGVSFVHNSWRARITIDGKEIHLGSFKTKEEAFQARLKAEEKYFKQFSPNRNKIKKK